MRGYYSAYRILESVREDLNEYSTARVQGSDTSGAYSNQYLMKKINEAHRQLYQMLIIRIKEYFTVKATANFSASAFTLPADFGRLIILKDEYKQKVSSLIPPRTRLANSAGNRKFYYQIGRILYSDYNNLTAAFEIWYVKRSRDLDMGMSSAGGALSITLATTARAEDDYYNGLKIENVTDDWVDTINDYTSARACTLAVKTGAASKYYGIISDIPEDFHHLIAPLAVLKCKHKKVDSIGEIKDPEIEDWKSMFSMALVGFAGTSWDETPDDIFLDLDPFTPTGMGIVS